MHKNIFIKLVFASLLIITGCVEQVAAHDCPRDGGPYCPVAGDELTWNCTQYHTPYCPSGCGYVEGDTVFTFPTTIPLVCDTSYYATGICAESLCSPFSTYQLSPLTFNGSEINWTCTDKNNVVSKCAVHNSAYSAPQYSKLVTKKFEWLKGGSWNSIRSNYIRVGWDGKSKIKINGDALGKTNVTVEGYVTIKNFGNNKSIDFGSMSKEWTGTKEIQSILSPGGNNVLVFIFSSTHPIISTDIYLTGNISSAGICGTANHKLYAPSDTSYGTDTQCLSGTSTNTAFPSQGATVKWKCTGINGGADTNCSASRDTTTIPVNGACGTANGKTYGASDTSYGTDTQCLSGTSSNTAFPAQGATVTWTCNGASGGTNANCSASRALVITPINGICGAANGKSFSSAPTTDLCSAGTASVVSGSGPWTWTCDGVNGGTNANCSANKSATCDQLVTSGATRVGDSNPSLLYINQITFNWDGAKNMTLVKDLATSSNITIYGDLNIFNLSNGQSISFGTIDSQWTGSASVNSILTSGNNQLEFVIYGKNTLQTSDIYLKCD